MKKDIKQYQEDIKAGVDVGGHETMHGWCCACPYDQIELNHRLQVQKAEILSTIKGVGLEEGIDLVTIAKIINKLR
jgi:hypothetical protein